MVVVTKVFYRRDRLKKFALKDIGNPRAIGPVHIQVALVEVTDAHTFLAHIFDVKTQ